MDWANLRLENAILNLLINAVVLCEMQECNMNGQTARAGVYLRSDCSFLSS